MQRTFTYTITEQDAGMSVTDFLKSQGFSRHLLSRMKEFPGAITINGARPYPPVCLCAGDRVEAILPPEPPSPNISPVNLPLPVIYEDEDLIVVDKPADMPIHPSVGNYDNTLANGLAWYYQQRGIPFVFRCINRLDRDTSGLLVVAKNALSGSLLSQQMKCREIHREYLVVVTGILKGSGTVDIPIGRREGSVLERCVDFDRGERAVTHYECLAVSEERNLSLLRIVLETGRTHQIRVHMKHIGHPLPGDYLYNPDYTDYSRQPLHSWRLSFRHPISRRVLTFTSDIPADFHPRWFDAE